MKSNYLNYGVVIIATALIAGAGTFVVTDQSETLEQQDQKIENLENDVQNYKSDVSNLEKKLEVATKQEQLVEYFPVFESENVKFRGLNHIRINEPTAWAGQYDVVTTVYEDGEDGHLYYVTIAQYEYASDLEQGEKSSQNYLDQTSASDTFTIVDGNTLIAVEAYQGDATSSYRDQLAELKSQYE